MDEIKILHELNGPAREKCNYYNRTRNRLLITAYEGIPENLLLNVLGCLVSIVKCIIVLNYILIDDVF